MSPETTHLSTSHAQEFGHEAQQGWTTHEVTTPMGDMLIHHRPNWAYDDATAWMERARTSVLDGGKMEIGIGSHAEEVVTLGAHAPIEQIQRPGLISERQAIIRRIERGGGATCHEPGQIVFYPILSIRRFRMSVPAFTDLLLNAVCLFLKEFGVAGVVSAESPGVYVDNRKLASVGFRSRKGVITHGLAVNYSNDMEIFAAIAPCGDSNLEMASVSSALRGMRKEHRIQPIRDAMKLLESAFLLLCTRPPAS